MEIHDPLVTDPAVLAAMQRVPRERFVPEDRKPFAGRDAALPIGHGQTISQPSLVAYMTQEARLTRGARVLEIGTGSGYQAAIAAELSDQVYSIEAIPALAERAAATLRACGYHRIHLRQGDGYHGWPEAAPFDAILVTAAAPSIPPPLLDQLAEGGRALIPIGEHAGPQQLMLVTKSAGAIHTRVLLPVSFVPFTREGR